MLDESTFKITYIVKKWENFFLLSQINIVLDKKLDFPGSDGKASAYLLAGDPGLIPGWEDPLEVNGNPPSTLSRANLMDGGAL